jgi:antitoxin (DNA-binding transcriptional repressor) of toxin-antitoxin stability system
MATMTFKQVRNAPGKFEPLIKGGQTVRVTKRGKPFFDAVPPKRQSGLREFFRRIDAVWSNSGIEVSTSGLVASLRDSRE